MTFREMMKPRKDSSDMAGYRKWLQAEDGAMAAWFALFIPVFLGIGALAIDMSYTMLTRHHLQVAANSSALAGAGGLATSEATAIDYANTYADTNATALSGDVLPDANIEIGFVDLISVPRGDFVPVPADEIANAVRVTTLMAESNSNPLGLFLAGIAGLNDTDVITTATAVTYPIEGPNACIIALSESADESGLEINGGGGPQDNISGDGCAICVNSNAEGNPGALDIGGNSSIDVGVGGAIYVGGDSRIIGSSTTNPDPDPNLDVEGDNGDPLCEDPYVASYDGDPILDYPGDPCSVVDPSTGRGMIAGIDVYDHSISSPIMNQNIRTIDFVDGVDADGNPTLEVVDLAQAPGKFVPAGVHCNVPGGGILPGATPFKGTESFEFETGNHYFYDTHFTVSGLGGGDFLTTTTDGSTFVMSGSDLKIDNGTMVNFEGLNDVDGKPGFVFYQDPDNPNPEDPAEFDIGGGSDFILDGIVYLGLEDIKIHGDIVANEGTEDDCLILVAGTIEMDGTSNINLATAGCGLNTSVGPISVAIRLVD